MAIPLTARQIIERRKFRKQKRTARPTKPNRVARAEYNRDLQLIVNALIEQTNEVLPNLLIKLEPQYSQDARVIIQDVYARELNSAIASMAERSRNITSLARSISSQMVNGVNNQQRRAFYKAIQNSIGVDLNGIIQEEGLTDILESTVAENVSLIQSLPDEYYKKISTLVNESTNTKQNARSIIRGLQKIGIQSKKRAKLIARDQTQKLNASLTQERQTSLGIQEYEWQTSDDERVRPTHKANNGKTFRWDSPPPITGHPGEDVNCRCVALPIIDLSNRSQVA